MKCKVLFCFVFALIYNNLISQTYEYVSFPDSGAIWSEHFYYSGEKSSDFFEKFAINGEDTVINQLSYKKLYLFYNSYFDIISSTYIGGIREENKRIYYLGDTVHRYKPMSNLYNFQEILLYDFSLSIGDTLPSAECGDITPSNFLGCPIIVTNIDTVLYGNTYRKEFSFNMPWVKWVEGIGSIGIGQSGLLFYNGDILAKSPWQVSTLICFKQNDTIVYFNSNYPDCMPVNISQKMIEKINVLLFPNPANDKLYVELKENNNYDFSIIIYNLLGQIVKLEKLNQIENELNISNLTKGIYNVRIINKNEIANFKVIKE